MKSDLQIAQEAKLKPITEIAASIGIREDELDLYGKYKAKVSPDILKRLQDRPQGKYIVVTAVTPTPLGEGKTVTSIGLGQGLAKIGKNVINTLREPSMGPVFGIKGGAAGGGYSQVVPGGLKSSFYRRYPCSRSSQQLTLCYVRYPPAEKKQTGDRYP